MKSPLSHRGAGFIPATILRATSGHCGAGFMPAIIVGAASPHSPSHRG